MVEVGERRGGPDRVAQAEVRVEPRGIRGKSGEDRAGSSSEDVQVQVPRAEGDLERAVAVHVAEGRGRDDAVRPPVVVRVARREGPDEAPVPPVGADGARAGRVERGSARDDDVQKAVAVDVAERRRRADLPGHRDRPARHHRAIRAERVDAAVRGADHDLLDAVVVEVSRRGAARPDRARAGEPHGETRPQRRRVLRLREAREEEGAGAKNHQSGAPRPPQI